MSIRDVGQLSQILWKDWSRMHEPLSTSALSHKTVVDINQRRFQLIRPGRPPWPIQTRSWPTQTARVIPMIPTYTTPVGLPKICLASNWPNQMKIPRTAPEKNHIHQQTVAYLGPRSSMSTWLSAVLLSSRS